MKIRRGTGQYDHPVVDMMLVMVHVGVDVLGGDPNNPYQQ
jgi:hypothetical protein